MNVPEFLERKLEEQYGKKIKNKIIEGCLEERKVTLRINTLKTSKDKIKEILNKNNIEFKEIAWYEDALVIENVKEEKIKYLDIYENGEIYFQSLSSMLPPIFLEAKENENILDMTAAPGGKTTELYNLTNGKAYITACEKNKIRMDRLKYNLEKQGASRVSVINQDARELSDLFSFDKILLDAPCSGSGTLNLNIENSKFTEELIIRSVKTQKQLLNKAVKILKKGSEMIYSTCSVLYEENEASVLELIEKGIVETVPLNLEKFKDVPTLTTKINGAICVCPDNLFEGFFCVKLRRIK